MSMLMVQFFVGLVALVAGGELLVRGSSSLALSFRISPLVVGLTVVAFGTSAPELAVSLQSVLAGQVDLATGNVVGSNIFNVLFILGVSALITPLVVNRQLIRQEVPIMLGASVMLYLMVFDLRIGLLEGAILTTLMVVYTVFLIWQSRSESAPAPQPEADQVPVTHWQSHWAVQVLLIAAGLALLVFGADWLVSAAVSFAKTMGVSELVIGLTIVAAGTSLPEVATSLIAAFRGERDIAVGNVVGSNIFNIFGVLGISTLFSADGLSVAPALLSFDLLVMVAVAFACLPVFFSGHLISRREGGLFLVLYVAYTTYLVLFATRHALLPAYSQIMLVFVVPLVALTLVIIGFREWRQRD